MDFFYCKLCDKILHKVNFRPMDLYALNKGKRRRCRSCYKNFRTPGRTKKLYAYRVISCEYKMTNIELRALQLEAIRSLFRIWCNTGSMPEYTYCKIRRRTQYRTKKRMKDERSRLG